MLLISAANRSSSFSSSSDSESWRWSPIDAKYYFSRSFLLWRIFRLNKTYFRLLHSEESAAICPAMMTTVQLIRKLLTQARKLSCRKLNLPASWIKLIILSKFSSDEEAYCPPRRELLEESREELLEHALESPKAKANDPRNDPPKIWINPLLWSSKLY